MSVSRAFRLIGKDGSVRVVICPRKQIRNHIQDGDDVLEYMKPLREPVDYKTVDYIANFDPATKTVIIKDPIIKTDPIDDSSILNISDGK